MKFFIFTSIISMYIADQTLDSKDYDIQVNGQLPHEEGTLDSTVSLHSSCDSPVEPLLRTFSELDSDRKKISDKSETSKRNSDSEVIEDNLTLQVQLLQGKVQEANDTAKYFEARWIEANAILEASQRKLQLVQQVEQSDRSAQEAETQLKDFDQRVDEAQRKAEEAERRVEEAERRAEEEGRQAEKAERRAERRAEEAERRAEEAERRAEEEGRQAEKAERRAEEAERRAEEAERRAEEEGRQAEKAERRAEEAERRAEEEEKVTQEAYVKIRVACGRVEVIERRANELEEKAQRAEKKAEIEQRRAQEAKGIAEEEQKRATEAHRVAEELHIRAKQLEMRIERSERQANELCRTVQQLRIRADMSDRRAQDQERRAEEAERRAALLRRNYDEHWIINKEEVRFNGPEIGRGGWATVSVGEFRGVQIAIKRIHNQIVCRRNLQMFRREMHMASKLRHPNLVQFIGATVEGDMMILMEYMPTSLRKQLEIDEYFQPKYVKYITLDIARALNYLHQMQPDPMIHRDISSANVLLEPLLPPKLWKAKITDYGSVNLVRQLNTRLLEVLLIQLLRPSLPACSHRRWISTVLVY